MKHTTPVGSLPVAGTSDSDHAGDESDRLISHLDSCNGCQHASRQWRRHLSGKSCAASIKGSPPPIPLLSRATA